MDWYQHERQVNAYKCNLATPHVVELSGYVPSSSENKRYSKGIEDVSRRAMTSQPGRRGRKTRLTSGSSKSKNARRSERDAFEDHPYTSGLGQTTQNPLQDDSNMINITTQDHLNRTEGGRKDLDMFSNPFRHHREGADIQ